MASQPLGGGRARGLARGTEARRDVSAAVPGAANPLRGAAPGSTTAGGLNGPNADGRPANDNDSGATESSAFEADKWLSEFHDQVLLAPTQKIIAKRKARREAWSVAAGAVLKLLVAVAVVWVLFTQVFGLVRIEGSAMRPTAGDGDLVMTARIFDSIESDDLVIYEQDGKQVLGRVVAQPGDTVEVTDDGDLKVNGNVQPSVTQAATKPATNGSVTYPLTLGSGEYFVLNDSRDTTTDSREFGVVSLNEVKGKVIALLRLREI